MCVKDVEVMGRPMTQWEIRGLAGYGYLYFPRLDDARKIMLAESLDAQGGDSATSDSLSGLTFGAFTLEPLRNMDAAKSPRPGEFRLVRNSRSYYLPRGVTKSQIEAISRALTAIG